MSKTGSARRSRSSSGTTATARSACARRATGPSPARLRPHVHLVVAAVTALISVATAAAADAGAGSSRQVASPSADRHEATATLLPDGSVLVAGGSPEAQPAELFDPAKAAWSPTGPMVAVRVGHTATALGDGRVLVAGGVIGGEATTSAELYDPGTRSWVPTAPMALPRSFHTATILKGGRVLVAGGQAGGHGPFVREAEVFDPAAATWSPAGVIEQGRSFHAATMLADGRVLVTGGQGDPHGISLRDGAVYDPTANAWSVVPQLMSVGRSGHALTLLGDATVLVAGGTPQRQGDNDGDQIQASAELYDPADWSFRPAPPMATARAFHAAMAFPGGRALVVGGQSSAKGAVIPATTAELFDPDARRWVPAGSLVRAAGSGRTIAVLLAGQGCGGACGRVLAVDAGAQLLAPPSAEVVEDHDGGPGPFATVRAPAALAAAAVLFVGLAFVLRRRARRAGHRRPVAG